MAHLLGHCLDMDVEELIITAGDAHIYLDQIELVKEQLQRQPLGDSLIKINQEVKDLFAITAEDIEIVGYTSHPAIKYPVAV